MTEGRTAVPARDADVAPVLALGFRLFYLLAGAYAAVSVGVWALQFAGHLPGRALVQGPLAHAHEMLFGYTFAVIAGFLFTAVKNWTQRPTPTGAPLALLGLLWACARVLSFTPWAAWSALADAAFAIGVAAGIGRPLVASANRRNYFFIPLVLGIGAANVAFQAGVSGWADFSPQRALWVAADAVLLAITIVAGRVVPMFTNNAVPGAGARRMQTIEFGAIGSIVALLLADLAGVPATAGVIAALAALFHAARLALWAPLATRRAPMLWILHLSYAWLVAHLALRGLAAFTSVSPSLAMHALTVGAIGGMTLGMMTRSALGHTGRALAARPAETAMYVLVELAAVARVLVPLAFPAAYGAAVAAAGAFWFAAFLVFTVAYWPVLTRPRIDGHPG